MKREHSKERRGGHSRTPQAFVGRGLRLAVYIQPRASKTELAGLHDGVVKIRIAAPPVDHAANRELIEFVAARLGVARSRVTLVAGAASRRKVLDLAGVTDAEIAAAFAQ